MAETFYDVLRRQDVSRSFMKFCSLTAAALGLAPEIAPRTAHALETTPRVPVLWLHGLEGAC
jgi:hydrogenase small subunit